MLDVVAHHLAIGHGWRHCCRRIIARHTVVETKHIGCYRLVIHAWTDDRKHVGRQRHAVKGDGISHSMRHRRGKRVTVSAHNAGGRLAILSDGLLTLLAQCLELTIGCLGMAETWREGGAAESYGK